MLTLLPFCERYTFLLCDSYRSLTLKLPLWRLDHFSWVVDTSTLKLASALTCIAMNNELLCLCVNTPSAVPSVSCHVMLDKNRSLIMQNTYILVWPCSQTPCLRLVAPENRWELVNTGMTYWWTRWRCTFLGVMTWAEMIIVLWW